MHAAGRGGNCACMQAYMAKCLAMPVVAGLLVCVGVCVVCVPVCLCLRIFLLRRLAGNVSIAP